MSNARPRSRGSPTILFLVLVALAFGAAASVVAGAAVAPPFRSSSTPADVLPTWFFDLLVLAIFGSGIGFFVYLRLSRGAAVVPTQWVASIAIALLVGVAFVFLAQLFAGSAAVGSGTPGHSTGPGLNLTGGNATGNGTLAGGGTSAPSFHLPLPPWLLFVALSALVVGLALVATTPLWSAVVGRARSSATRRIPGAERDRVRGALASAAEALDAGGDPRATIEALYGAILARVGTMAIGLEGATPEEIRAEHLIRLGVRPAAAETLTRLFEEARYSTHPLGPGEVDRAARAIREASEDLDRAP
ncbi:MAG TPA: DUF4129 domain-containing protein [Thermoplasmata archaeon]|nr:DUF4129 domain-containing protein [Thermoplasmata archaeon]